MGEEAKEDKMFINQINLLIKFGPDANLDRPSIDEEFQLTQY